MPCLIHRNDGLFIHIIKQSTKLCVVYSSFQNPKPITSIPQCIFAYPVKNKIQNLSKQLLLYWEAIKAGNGEMKIPLSSPSSLHRKWHKRFAQIALLHWPQPRQRKTTLRMRQFRFVTGSLLTIPQNSQPQTTEKARLENFAVWAISALLTQPDSPYLKIKTTAMHT